MSLQVIGKAMWFQEDGKGEESKVRRKEKRKESEGDEEEEKSKARDTVSLQCGLVYHGSEKERALRN